MSANASKGLLAVVMAAVGAYCRELIIPVVVLFGVMLLDYVSGMTRAWMNKEMSSRVGVVGIVKKVFYLAAVAVAVVVDWVIQLAATEAGLNATGIYAFGLLVTVWLILNECISILENISAVGVPIPTFLGKIIERLKKSAESEGAASAGGGSGGGANDDR